MSKICVIDLASIPKEFDIETWMKLAIENKMIFLKEGYESTLLEVYSCKGLEAGTYQLYNITKVGELKVSE